MQLCNFLYIVITCKYIIKNFNVSNTKYSHSLTNSVRVWHNKILLRHRDQQTILCIIRISCIFCIVCISCFFSLFIIFILLFIFCLFLLLIIFIIVSIFVIFYIIIIFHLFIIFIYITILYKYLLYLPK